MSDKFTVKWGIDDGYAGENRPHSLIISDQDLYDDMDDADLRKLFWSELQNEFEQSIHYYSNQEDEFVKWAKGVIEKQKAEEEKQ